jgi:hypothetical protein
MSRVEVRCVLAILACLTTSACRTWQVQPGPPLSDVQWAMADSTKTIRLLMKSGASADVSAPAIVGDSIVGLSIPARTRLAFALNDVHSVARHEISSGRTAAAVAGTVVGALALMAAIAIIGLLASGPSP